MTKYFLILTFLFIFASLLKGQDTLNFKRINEAMQPAFLVVGQDTLQYKKITSIKLSEVCDYPPYNANRKEVYKNLSNEIDFLNIYLNQIADKNASYMQETKLFNLKNSINNFKKSYPNFDISGYQTVYNYFEQKQNQEKEQKKVAQQWQEKRQVEYQKRTDSLRQVKEIQSKIALAEQSKKDSISSTAMLTVEENGQEYEIGYQKEYLEQMSFISQHPHLCRFIGFKYYWVTHIPKYLIEEETFTLESAKLGSDGNLIIKMTPYFRTEAFYGKMQIKAKVDNDDRVTSLVITGHPLSLIHLFLWYWTSTPSLNTNSKLKSGLSYKKMIYDEDIIFKYTSTPSITIKKRK